MSKICPTMKDAHHSIRVVARRTGLTPHVLRVWERRYNAVEPTRTDTNRRLYSEDQINRFMLLAAAVRAGHSIKNVANLPTEKLRKLSAEAGNEPAPVAPARPTPAHLAAQCLHAVKNLDAAAFEDALNRGATELGAQGVAIKVIAPMVTQIGDLWRDGEITSAHEHFATALIRMFLANATRPYGGSENAPVIVVATPAGQLHELGALLAALIASNLGWNVKYIGGSLPAAEIAGVSVQSNARAIALSIVYPEDDPRLTEELKQLRAHLPETAIFVGGRAANAYRDTVKKISATYCKDIQEFAVRLDESRSRV